MDFISKAVADIQEADAESPHGGFTAVLSTPSLDRDGDRLHRQEWVEPLPERLPLDVDHGMSVADTIGSFRPYFDGDRLMMQATFASTPRAQEVRTLIKEGHINTVSVAFLTDKNQKDGSPRREILNAGVVACPSNRDAVILDSKALDKRSEELALETKANKEPYGSVEYADPGFQEDRVKRYPVNSPEHVRAAWSYIHQSRDRDKYTPEQLSHIETVIRHAAEKFGVKLGDDGKSFEPDETKGIYVDVIPRLDEDALKRVMGQIVTKAAGGDAALISAIHDASVHLGAQCIVMEPDVDPDSGADDGSNKGVDKQEAFEKSLDEILPSDDSPAEAAAATDEVPAPAVDAAGSKTKKRNRALGLMAMSAN